MISDIDTFIINQWSPDCEFEFKIATPPIWDLEHAVEFTDTIYRYGGWRRRVYAADGRIVWSKKENRHMLPVTRGLKVVCVQEITGTPRHRYLGPVVLTRKQRRMSRMLDNNWRMDYSFVEGKGYELEVEWVGEGMPMWRGIMDTLLEYAGTPTQQE
jgi:hypothetical protein